MTKAKKILFVTQEMMPFVPETDLAEMGRYLPQAVQEKSREIRSFMPKWGTINERRNQLHEVIRLSGINIVVDDTDHPLVIKVASIPAARMQIYFIDNDDFFEKRKLAFDEEGTVHEKMSWAFLAIQENLRMHRLLWIDGNSVMTDAQTGKTLGTYPEVADMVRNGVYAATNFSDMYNYSHDLGDALKRLGMESALIMQVDRHRPELGYVVVCPEVHTMHLWQDEEIAAIYVMCRMLAGELVKEGIGIRE